LLILSEVIVSQAIEADAETRCAPGIRFLGETNFKKYQPPMIIKP
jgi:hypothetical protein